jgi:hypothetical protein
MESEDMMYNIYHDDGRWFLETASELLWFPDLNELRDYLDYLEN